MLASPTSSSFIGKSQISVASSKASDKPRVGNGGNRSYVAAFQRYMKKLVNTPHTYIKIAELGEIEFIMYSGGATIDTFIVDHSYYIEELLNYCRFDVGDLLRLRGIRLIASICQSSKILREMLRKKGAVVILNESLMSKDSSDEMCRWAVHALRFLAVKDDGLTVLQSEATQKRLLEMARKPWKDWGNNDAEDILKMSASKKLDLLKL